jgi:hypothetical protein
MAYSRTIWDLVSAKNLNHAEGQYAAAKTEIDLHGHPDAHYLKAESDIKFFPIASGMDAQYIDGSDLDDLLGFQVDPGIIILHTAADADFTNGYLNADTRWHQCDGGTYNGIKSPDTRHYFPKCPAAVTTVGQGGASGTILTGTATMGPHTLTLAEIPSHYHKWTDRYYTGNTQVKGAAYMNLISGNTYVVSGLTTDLNHSGDTSPHDQGTKEVTFNSIALTPLWKAYHFLIKVD